MTKEMAKEAFEAAENDLKSKRIDEVKRIVTKTLEKLDDVKGSIKELQEKERILKMDIDDLKEGRLDRIAERQEKDDKARQVSVVVIIKEKETIREVPYNPWYYPYKVVWTNAYYQPLGVKTTDNFIGYCQTTGGSGYSDLCCDNTTIDGSTAKYATVGTYTIGSHTVHLR